MRPKPGEQMFSHTCTRTLSLAWSSISSNSPLVFIFIDWTASRISTSGLYLFCHSCKKRMQYAVPLDYCSASKFSGWLHRQIRLPLNMYRKMPDWFCYSAYSLGKITTHTHTQLNTMTIFITSLQQSEDASKLASNSWPHTGVGCHSLNILDWLCRRFWMFSWY